MLVSGQHRRGRRSVRSRRRDLSAVEAPIDRLLSNWCPPNSPASTPGCPRASLRDVAPDPLGGLGRYGTGRRPWNIVAAAVPGAVPLLPRGLLSTPPLTRRRRVEARTPHQGGHSVSHSRNLFIAARLPRKPVVDVDHYQAGAAVRRLCKAVRPLSRRRSPPTSVRRSPGRERSRRARWQAASIPAARDDDLVPGDSARCR